MFSTNIGKSDSQILIPTPQFETELFLTNEYEEFTEILLLFSIFF
ncbi:unnamed protein product, partial [marine sediment metagenome]